MTEQSVEIVEGEGEQSLSVEVGAPELREVAISAGRGVSLFARPEADLDAGRLAPGRYDVLGARGSCPDDPWSCVDEACAKCEVAVAELVVPWKDDVEAFTHPLAGSRSGPRPGIVPKPDPVAPTPDPKPSATGPGRRITYGAFASWLAKHPDWARETAIAAGKANDAYLMDWSGTTPPAGKEAQPMVNISWYAASAYCYGRGGLADIDAEPHSWSGAPALELRSAGGRGAWRDDGGTTSKAVKLSDANMLTGARCAK